MSKTQERKEKREGEKEREDVRVYYIPSRNFVSFIYSLFQFQTRTHPSSHSHDLLFADEAATKADIASLIGQSDNDWLVLGYQNGLILTIFVNNASIDSINTFIYELIQRSSWSLIKAVGL